MTTPISRDHLPIPDAKYVGLTTYDAKDPQYQVSADHGAAAAQGRAECARSC